jgi:hypothetical protein
MADKDINCRRDHPGMSCDEFDMRAIDRAKNNILKRNKDNTNVDHKEQPPPVPNNRESSHDVAIESLGRRKELGLSRYGSLLQPGNGRNSLRDLREELEDGLVYAVNFERTLEEVVSELRRLRDLFDDGSTPVDRINRVIFMLTGEES